MAHSNTIFILNNIGKTSGTNLKEGPQKEILVKDDKTENQTFWQDIRDFIEAPSKNLSKDQLTKGQNQLHEALNKEEGPDNVFKILSDHTFIPIIDLLEDLAEKVDKETLKFVFEQCLSSFVASINYPQVLERFKKIAPDSQQLMAQHNTHQENNDKETEYKNIRAGSKQYGR